MPKVLDNFRFSSASNVGRGGMEAKVASAWDAAQAGVTTVIANGKQPSVLLRVSSPCPTPELPTVLKSYCQHECELEGGKCM